MTHRSTPSFSLTLPPGEGNLMSLVAPQTTSSKTLIQIGREGLWEYLTFLVISQVIIQQGPRNSVFQIRAHQFLWTLKIYGPFFGRQRFNGLYRAKTLTHEAPLSSNWWAPILSNWWPFYGRTRVIG